MSASGRASFYESRPDLTDEQILETWDGIGGSRAADRETDDPVILWFQVKAKMRVLSMVLGFEPQREPSCRVYAAWLLPCASEAVLTRKNRSNTRSNSSFISVRAINLTIQSTNGNRE